MGPGPGQGGGRGTRKTGIYVGLPASELGEVHDEPSRPFDEAALSLPGVSG